MRPTRKRRRKRGLVVNCSSCRKACQGARNLFRHLGWTQHFNGGDAEVAAMVQRLRLRARRHLKTIEAVRTGKRVRASRLAQLRCDLRALAVFARTRWAILNNAHVLLGAEQEHRPFDTSLHSRERELSRDVENAAAITERFETATERFCKSRLVIVVGGLFNQNESDEPIGTNAQPEFSQN